MYYEVNTFYDVGNRIICLKFEGKRQQAHDFY